MDIEYIALSHAYQPVCNSRYLTITAYHERVDKAYQPPRRLRHHPDGGDHNGGRNDLQSEGQAPPECRIAAIDKR
jgi:hypothetical protein